jgi:NADH-quinone oxidoreductase subunit E
MLKQNFFSEEVIEQLEVWLKKYPKDQRRSAVIPGLHVLQDHNKGSLTTELMNQLASYLGVSEVSVYEVATFYGMYNLSTVGKHQINICNNISCKLRGADEIVGHVSNKLGIKPGETTKDNKFTLRTVECQGACCGAPMMEVGKVFYEKVTCASVDKIIDGLES